MHMNMKEITVKSSNQGHFNWLPNPGKKYIYKLSKYLHISVRNMVLSGLSHTSTLKYSVLGATKASFLGIMN